MQFLMELQIKQFWILKGHGTINSNKYAPDVLNTFCATLTDFKTQILQRMYELISAFATQKFCSFG